MQYCFRDMLQLVAYSSGRGPAVPLRVAVVSKDRLVRIGLLATLESFDDLSVVADLEPDDLLESRLRVIAPDVVLSDLAIGSDIPTLLLTSDAASSHNANGVLSRSATAEQIDVALHAIAEGLRVTDSSPVVPNQTEPLTHRELEVLHLLAEGLTNKEIAQRLVISEHTVKFHVNAILSKLGAATRTEAVVHAARLGIVVL